MNEQKQLDAQRQMLRPIIEPIASYIFAADEADFVYRAIAEHAVGVNEHNLGLCLRAVQATLADSYLLALTKLFEAPNPRYPLHSIPVALDFLESHRADFAELDESYARSVLSSLSKGPCGEVLDQVVPNVAGLLEQFRRTLPGAGGDARIESLDSALDALRSHRNKRIAHPENILGPPLPSASWDEARRLLDYAKCFVGSIGWALMNTLYVTSDGEYILSREAERASVCMSRLFEMAGVQGGSAD